MPPTKYTVRTWSPHERKSDIQTRVDNSEQLYAFYEYQNTETQLKVIRVAIDSLLYRVSNYRTRTAQLRYIRDNHKPETFFSAQQENESVQQAQHGLLIALTERGKNSVTSITEVLMTEGQREPLLITIDGIVVNGNRRLAAMRELYQSDNSQYDSFSHVNCAVLPHGATPEELRETEVRLQMRPETKLPYSWIDEAMAVSDLLEAGKTPRYVAKLMRKRITTIERTIAALSEVDIYLEEGLQKPGHYHEVEEAAQLFRDLAGALASKDGTEKEVSRRMAWVLLQHADKFGRRIYDFNFIFSGQTSEVVSSLVDELGSDVLQPTHGSRADSMTEGMTNDASLTIGLDTFTDSDVADDSMPSILAVLQDGKHEAEIVDAIVEVSTSIRERNQEETKQRAARVALTTIAKKLKEVRLSNAHPSTYAAIADLLQTIVEYTSVLQEKLEKLEGHPRDG